MIKIVIYQNKDGVCTGFKMKGHAEYAKKGQDIVCAAVSVLAVNTINSIETFTTDIPKKQEVSSGFVEYQLFSDSSESTRLLLSSFILGLKGIREEYGSAYIQLKFKEV